MLEGRRSVTIDAASSRTHLSNRWWRFIARPDDVSSVPTGLLLGDAVITGRSRVAACDARPFTETRWLCLPFLDSQDSSSNPFLPLSPTCLQTFTERRCAPAPLVVDPARGRTSRSRVAAPTTRSLGATDVAPIRRGPRSDPALPLPTAESVGFGRALAAGFVGSRADPRRAQPPATMRPWTKRTSNWTLS